MRQNIWMREEPNAGVLKVQIQFKGKMAEQIKALAVEMGTHPADVLRMLAAQALRGEQ